MEQHQLNKNEMSVNEYYNILGLHAGCGVEEIKKAYRKKAREFHPDINPSPSAKDMFILITEAYEFLLTYSEKAVSDAEAYNRAMEDWRKYRQARSRQRANAYARTSYVRFKNTNFYKTIEDFRWYDHYFFAGSFCDGACDLDCRLYLQDPSSDPRP